MKIIDLSQELKENTYPGRGIIVGKSQDGKSAVCAYFIMGRSANSRNRVFVEDGNGIRTKAFDESKLEDPSLIIYAPVRVLGNKTIVTNGDQTDTIYELMNKQMTFEQAMTRLEEIVSQLENGEHTLEDALSLYEEGVKRMKQCVSMLDRAEQKVRKLRTDENGELSEVPFVPEE